MVMADREHIPSYRATLASPRPLKIRSWSEQRSDLPSTPIDAQLFAGKRLVIFGEQHHQAQVLRAQMQIMSMLHRQQQQSKQVVMILEHFNFQQNDLLDRFSKSLISSDAFMQEYAQSKEGFNLNHYLPLLLLARELGIPMYGGFPPRPWASVVYKESIEVLQAVEVKTIPRDFDEARWRQVTQITNEHVAYLRSMMSGDPPSMPDPADDTRDETYTKGILPAQTLKDTFMAYTIDQHLQQPETLVYAVCGLGHSEFEQCVSARVQACRRDEICLVATKDWSSEEYLARDAACQGDLKLADIIILYDAV